MMFADGNFKAPMLIHDQTPHGVPVMYELKDEIKFDFEEIDRGAAVRISTKNPMALKAIHDFLRFSKKNTRLEIRWILVSRRARRTEKILGFST
jgi:hypothetical protein